MTTIAEELEKRGEARGRAEGEAKGRAEGRASVLRKQLALKFGPLDPVHEQRIDAASVDELDRYAERILTAETVEAVFA